jgi:hypothetical protein
MLPCKKRHKNKKVMAMANGPRRSCTPFTAKYEVPDASVLDRRRGAEGTNSLLRGVVFGGVLFKCMDSLKVIDIDMRLQHFQSKLKLLECFNKLGDLVATAKSARISNHVADDE